MRDLVIRLVLLIICCFSLIAIISFTVPGVIGGALSLIVFGGVYKKQRW